jgi:glycosyltransferase involved in cell wall biosynthesis
VRHPVTVIIPTIESRINFLMSQCLPSVYENRPSQIVIVGGDDWNGNEKRNSGAAAATQPYVLFVDDDSRLLPGAIEHLLGGMFGDAAFAFGGYRYNTENFYESVETVTGNEVFPGKWNHERLKTGNYIDTTSLIRRDMFPGFDPKIQRFQDWDLWLTMASLGRRGNYIPFCVVEKFVIDERVSVRIPENEARDIITRKHNL